MPHSFSRRAVLRQITLGAAATAAPVRHAFAQADAEPWYFLTDDEARWIAAIVDVFIPEDDFPSASQAGAVDYIDLQMSTGYGAGEGLYMRGPFLQGTPEQGYQLPMTPAEMLRSGLQGLRDSELGDVTAMDASGREAFVQRLSKREGLLGEVPASMLFDELMSLANEGYFADPIYRGNHDYAGWRMVGFPGAHAYFTERVGDNRPTFQPPMGIAHGRMRGGAPRPVGQEG